MRNDSTTYQRIWKIVQSIPHGRVATYGQVAVLAGFPGQARLVGYALHATPEEMKLPWHRVINSRGEISFPPDDHRYHIQKKLLELEGIIFQNNKIDLKIFRWNPGEKIP
ncbi:MAG: methylated-DNA--[protein]-cysteine S-methyltransferase [Calditrichaeota bacterium]|nr:MAG: methylated-DNA--[protein]-cysteine S-methyltransferase [Calditrichota bacterium]